MTKVREQMKCNPSRSQIDGSGLGLAIAKWIAELHHAYLTVSSQAGQGSVFTLILPICANA